MTTVAAPPAAQEFPDRGIVRAELGARIDEVLLPQDVARAAQQVPLRPFGDLIVVEEPSEFVYGGRLFDASQGFRADLEFRTPRSRFISLMTCEDQIYSIRVAPQLEKLSLGAATDLAQTLAQGIDKLDWRMETEDEPGPLAERLKERFREEGRLRYVFNRRSLGNNSVYLTVERMEPGLFGRLLRRGGEYLVNVVFRDAALEHRLLTNSWRRGEPPRS